MGFIFSREENGVDRVEGWILFFLCQHMACVFNSVGDNKTSLDSGLVCSVTALTIDGCNNKWQCKGFCYVCHCGHGLERKKTILTSISELVTLKGFAC